ncbi:MAG: 1-phosphofructokinase [Blautia sp.]|nr:1-phosphofructokinase [Blautia sp.]MDY3997817.1 1-phosphofructokinase [Blautia sp.]
MIITVTMNPAIDKTVEIDTLVHGGLNRIRKVEYDAGGKGINVSKTLLELGGTSIASGFLAGNNGRTIARVLKEKGIISDFVRADGETRTNTKVFEQNGSLTELNEPGPAITREQIEALMNKLDSYAGRETLFVLSGSIPEGVPGDTYARIIRMVHRKGAAVLLDADGDLFRLGIEAGPDILKPNRTELEEYAGLGAGASETELRRIAEKLKAQGAGTIAISMGREGALFVFADSAFRCPALSVKAHSTVGAGDAMVAGLAFAWENRLSAEETMRLCMAVSAGAVTTIGTKPPSWELTDRLMEQVIISKTQQGRTSFPETGERVAYPDRRNIP